ncbi:MerR family transcriptional regulator, partial [Tessaracoccus lubricantis]
MPEWLRIGEVSRLTGLTHRTLRHYDDLGLLVPSGRSYSDYRLYSAADMERLLAIQHLKSLGLSLDEVRQVLDEPGTDAADLIDRHIAAVEETLAQEGERRARLQRLRAAAQIGWDDVLDVLSLGQQLQHADPNVRFRAALTEQGSAAVEDLVERLRSDPEPEVREAATWALVHRGAVVMNAIDSLRDGDERARHSLAHLLGKLRDPAGVATLADLA